MSLMDGQAEDRSGAEENPVAGTPSSQAGPPLLTIALTEDGASGDASLKPTHPRQPSDALLRASSTGVIWALVGAAGPQVPPRPTGSESAFK